MNHKISNTPTITQYLIDKYRFNKIFKSAKEEKLDIDQFTCILRVHVIHFLFYSELHKHFSIGVRHEHPKKSTNGEINEWTTVMIPKVINSIEEADNLIKGIL